MRNLSRHLTYANVMSTLAVVLVIGGGVAYAANTVFSSDIVNGEVRRVDIGTNQVRSINVASQALTGADSKDQAGVDTCTHGTTRFGELCVGTDNVSRGWVSALSHCGDLELRFPSAGEAVSLAKNYDVPNVDSGESFWTEEYSAGSAFAIDDDGDGSFSDTSSASETVCVTTPTN